MLTEEENKTFTRGLRVEKKIWCYGMLPCSHLLNTWLYIIPASYGRDNDDDDDDSRCDYMVGCWGSRMKYKAVNCELNASRVAPLHH